MKYKFLLLLFAVCVVHQAKSERIDIFGCYAFHDILVDLFSADATEYFWFPNCLPGGFWDNVQCSIHKCYCAYVDTGSQIPETGDIPYDRLKEDCPVMVSSDTDKCKPQQSSLPCGESNTRYVYDEGRKGCVRMTGVCHGFDSLNACNRKCANKKFDRCSFTRDSGTNKCSYPSAGTRFFHDTNGNCRPFRYRGCGGNSNSYNSKWECLKQCESQLEEETLVTISGTLYKAILPQWLVIREKFVPDVNNDISSEKYREIESYIKKLTKAVRPGADKKVGPPEYAGKDPDPMRICKMKSETGPCRALFHRWHYSEVDGKCIEFIYGGCFPNANNFRNATHCEDYCEPVRRGNSESGARSFDGDDNANTQQFESADTSGTFTWD